MLHKIHMALAIGVSALVVNGAAFGATNTAKSHKLPDWSGVWDPVEGNMFDPRAGLYVGDPRGNTPRENPPLTPEYEKKYQVEIDLAAQGKPRDPTSACVPPGMPRIMSSPYAREFVITPYEVLYLTEYQNQIIRIFTDGHKHPPADDLDPSYNGHSIGHWEGDTLVFDTVGMRSDTWFDRTGAPHSDKLHVTQRMRQVKPGLIETVITMQDPIAFTKPWVVTRHFKKVTDGYQIMESVCTDNNRVVLGPNGPQVVESRSSKKAD